MTTLKTDHIPGSQQGFMPEDPELESLSVADRRMVETLQSHYQPAQMESWEARRFLEGLEARRQAHAPAAAWRAWNRFGWLSVPLACAALLVLALGWPSAQPQPASVASSVSPIPKSAVEPASDVITLGEPDPNFNAAASQAIADAAPVTVDAEMILAMSSDLDGVVGSDDDDDELSTSETGSPGLEDSTLALVFSEELVAPDSDNAWLPDDYQALDALLPEALNGTSEQRSL